MRAKWGNQARNLSKSKKKEKKKKNCNKKGGREYHDNRSFGQLLAASIELWPALCTNFAWDFRHLLLLHRLHIGDVDIDRSRFYTIEASVETDTYSKITSRHLSKSSQICHLLSWQLTDWSCRLVIGGHPWQQHHLTIRKHKTNYDRITQAIYTRMYVLLTVQESVRKFVYGRLITTWWHEMNWNICLGQWKCSANVDHHCGWIAGALRLEIRTAVNRSSFSYRCSLQSVVRKLAGHAVNIVVKRLG